MEWKNTVLYFNQLISKPTQYSFTFNILVSFSLIAWDRRDAFENLGLYGPYVSPEKV